MLADDRRSWQLQPDATWGRTETLLGRPGTIDTFEMLKEDALCAARSPRPRTDREPVPARSTRAHDARTASDRSRSS